MTVSVRLFSSHDEVCKQKMDHFNLKFSVTMKARFKRHALFQMT